MANQEREESETDKHKQGNKNRCRNAETIRKSENQGDDGCADKEHKKIEEPFSDPRSAGNRERLDVGETETLILLDKSDKKPFT